MEILILLFVTGTLSFVGVLGGIFFSPIWWGLAVVSGFVFYGFSGVYDGRY